MQIEIALELRAALRCERTSDEGTLSPDAIAIVKRSKCGKALTIARVACDMHGGNGVAATAFRPQREPAASRPRLSIDRWSTEIALPLIATLRNGIGRPSLTGLADPLGLLKQVTRETSSVSKNRA